ncbi:hypothetical protein GGS21DRAFT_488733 [Xylaria nigripes]|nr:hypothetical protein GGS21DRAFT_488733 [Xylaria nigripes]
MRSIRTRDSAMVLLEVTAAAAAAVPYTPAPALSSIYCGMVALKPPLAPFGEFVPARDFRRNRPYWLSILGSSLAKRLRYQTTSFVK